MGLSDISSGLLVWRQALPAEETTPEDQREDETGGQTGGAAPGSVDSGQRRPRRFFGSITLNPDNPGLQVAKIAEEILFELTRPRGAELRLTLEIEGSASDGYPDDVVDVVRSNLRDLKIDMGEVGFEEE
jgi:hypothetical protein